MAIKRIVPAPMVLTLPDHWAPFHELPFQNDIIKPGDLIKIKEQTATYRVIRFIHSMKSGEQWVDAMNTATGGFHSFYLHRIRTVIRQKKSRQKKV